MMDVKLKCNCGNVQGIAHNIGANTGNRIVCYCNDCQAFAHFLEGEHTILDQDGGTDIYQTTHAQVEITEGTEHIRCMRLSAKGMFRWYAGCCKTPIGNTLSAGAPFIGMIHNFMDNKDSRDTSLGPIRGYFYTKHAKPSLSEERKKLGIPLTVMLNILVKLLMWKLKGMNKPSPVFDHNGLPISEPNISSMKIN